MKKIISVIITLICLMNIFAILSSAKENLPVEIKAESAILMDCNSGNVLLSFNEHKKLPPASVTKIMPLLLVVEAIDKGEISLKDKVTVSSEAAAKGGSQIWLKEGETMSVNDMLKAVAVASANDACAALGEYIAGSESAFVNRMNKRAKELGMKDTKFVNCSGLDDEDSNITSAYDIAVMSSELMKHKLIRDYTTIWMDSLRNGETELVNTNKLVRFYKGTTGLKTGTTSKAGCCLSATAERDGLHLCAVVMGSKNSKDRFESAKALLNYGFANWESVKPVCDKKLITDVQVIKGEKNSVKPIVPKISNVVIKKGQEENLKQTISLSLNVNAPVEKGQTLGTLEFSADGKTLAKYSLVSPEKIPERTLLFVFRKLLSSFV